MDKNKKLLAPMMRVTCEMKLSAGVGRRSGA